MLKPIPKVETLAHLYLEGDVDEISDATIMELCNWIWTEFQSSPQSQRLLWFERYSNIVELFNNVKQSHLWAAEKNYDITLETNPIYHFIFHAMHNNDYYHAYSNVHLEEEIATYNAAAKIVPSLIIQKIIYSEKCPQICCPSFSRLSTDCQNCFSILQMYLLTKCRYSCSKSFII
jgi:hypothetical protein